MQAISVQLQPKVVGVLYTHEAIDIGTKLAAIHARERGSSAI